MNIKGKGKPDQAICKQALSWFKSLENSKKVYLRTQLRLKDNIDIARYYIANIRTENHGTN
jgi:hypothetical protein